MSDFFAETSAATSSHWCCMCGRVSGSVGYEGRACLFRERRAAHVGEREANRETTSHTHTHTHTHIHTRAYVSQVGVIALHASRSRPRNDLPLCSRPPGIDHSGRHFRRSKTCCAQRWSSTRTRRSEARTGKAGSNRVRVRGAETGNRARINIAGIRLKPPTLSSSDGSFGGHSLQPHVFAQASEEGRRRRRRRTARTRMLKRGSTIFLARKCVNFRFGF